jgi:hypothetical protein
MYLEIDMCTSERAPTLDRFLFLKKVEGKILFYQLISKYLTQKHVETFRIHGRTRTNCKQQKLLVFIKILSQYRFLIKYNG